MCLAARTLTPRYKLLTLVPLPAYIGKGIIINPAIAFLRLSGAILGRRLSTDLAKRQNRGFGANRTGTEVRRLYCLIALVVILTDALKSPFSSIILRFAPRLRSLLEDFFISPSIEQVRYIYDERSKLRPSVSTKLLYFTDEIHTTDKSAHCTHCNDDKIFLVTIRIMVRDNTL